MFKNQFFHTNTKNQDNRLSTKLRIRDWYFFLKILSTQIKCGKKKKFFNLFSSYFSYFFRFKFYKTNTDFYFRKYYYNLDFCLKHYQKFFNIIFVFKCFFTKHTPKLGFFVGKHQAYINKKKKFFSNMYIFIIKPKLYNCHLLKYARVLYLKTKFKKKLPLFIKQNLLKPTNSAIEDLYKDIAFATIQSKKK